MYTISENILVRDFSKILKSQGIDMGERKLFQWLNSNGYIYRDKLTNQWLPRKISKNLKIIKQKISIWNNFEKSTLLITEPGQLFLIKQIKLELKKEGIKDGYAS